MRTALADLSKVLLFLGVWIASWSLIVGDESTSVSAVNAGLFAAGFCVVAGLALIVAVLLVAVLSPRSPTG